MDTEKKELEQAEELLTEETKKVAEAEEDPFDTDFWNTPEQAPEEDGQEASGEQEETPGEPPKYEISYVLEKDEIKSAFELLGSFKMNTKGQWIRSALLVLVVAITVYNITLDGSYLGMGIFLISLCALLIAAIWLLPIYNKKRAVDKAYDPDTTIVRVYDDRVATGKAQFRKFREIPLNKDTGVEFGKGIYAVKMPEKRFIVIPERAIPFEDRESVRSILFGWNHADVLPEYKPEENADGADCED